MNNLLKEGGYVDTDSTFVAKYRLKQSEYRKKVLKEMKCGIGPKRTSTDHIGNYLINGEKTGKNFLTDAAFKYAKLKVCEKQINTYLTIDEYRLFNNMLSSMPMCFNLFSDLRQLLVENKEDCTKVIQKLFSEIDWINEVKYIDIEFIPVPIKKYINDRTAFDAIIIVTDQANKKGIISVETKYTDVLGSNVSKSDELNNIIRRGKLFTIETQNELFDNGFKQIYRNYLLTFIYAKKNRFKHFANVVISLEEDKRSLDEINLLKTQLIKYQDCIFKINLEEFVYRGKTSRNEIIKYVMTKFTNRYFV